MKILFTQVILMLVSVLFSQVNFEFQYEVDYPTDYSNLRNIQMFDVNNDNDLDIALFFKDSNNNLLLQCYQSNGDFICGKIFSGSNFEPEKGCLHEFNNEIIVIGVFTEEYEIMAKVYNFQTGAVMDSLIVNETNLWNLFPDDITDLKAFTLNNEVTILLGFVNNSGIVIYETKTIRFLYNGNLSIEQIYDDIGKQIIDIPEAEELLITGFYYSADDISSNLTKYLKFISKTDYATVTNFIESSGNSSSSGITNWPYQFEIITMNDINYSNYGWMFQKVTYDNGNYNIEFVNYEPNSSNQIWNSTMSEIGYSEVLATTCIEVNNEPHYVMYFRDNSLEIRDRCNGDIVHVQPSAIIPTYIFRNSSNELLFFVNDDINNLIRVYKLENEIYVISDNENLPEPKFKITNFPNPFNPSTTIEFSIKNDSNIDLSIYNLKGQKVTTLINEQMKKGKHATIWSGLDSDNKPVSSGIYLYKIKVGNQVSTNRMLLLK